MILFIDDNLLKVHRILPLDVHGYTPHHEDGTPTLDYSESNLTILLTKKIKFTLELGHKEVIPKCFKGAKKHPLGEVLGLNWYIPEYWEDVRPHIYDVEYLSVKGNLKYKAGLTENALRIGINTTGINVRHVFSETGLTEEFLAEFKFVLVVKGKFRYAAKRIQKRVKLDPVKELIMAPVIVPPTLADVKLVMKGVKLKKKKRKN